MSACPKHTDCEDHKKCNKIDKKFMILYTQKQKI